MDVEEMKKEKAMLEMKIGKELADFITKYEIPRLDLHIDRESYFDLGGKFVVEVFVVIDACF